ncbi:MAG: hypothetical protein HY329_06910 [Chloroflexi bacterium]|nr:hypothetical protein [Chloroflexota bacterium]
MNLRLVLVCCLTLLLLACSSTPEPTPTPDPFQPLREQANTLFQSGQQKFQQGDFAGAVSDLDRARRADPDQRPEITDLLQRARQALNPVPTPVPTSTPVPGATPAPPQPGETLSTQLVTNDIEDRRARTEASRLSQTVANVNYGPTATAFVAFVGQFRGTATAVVQAATRQAGAAATISSLSGSFPATATAFAAAAPAVQTRLAADRAFADTFRGTATAASVARQLGVVPGPDERGQAATATANAINVGVYNVTATALAASSASNNATATAYPGTATAIAGLTTGFEGTATAIAQTATALATEIAGIQQTQVAVNATGTALAPTVTPTTTATPTRTPSPTTTVTPVPSPTASFTPTPVPAPQGLAVVLRENQPVLTWQASPGAASYNVYWALSGNGPFSLLNLEGPIFETTFTDPTPLQPGETRHYFVVAVNFSAESRPSNRVNVTR